jgi:hypothetical protein
MDEAVRAGFSKKEEEQQQQYGLYVKVAHSESRTSTGIVPIITLVNDKNGIVSKGPR